MIIKNKRMSISISLITICILLSTNGIGVSVSSTLMDTSSSDPQQNSILIPSENASINYVIITTDVLESSVEFFKNWKELLGFQVMVTTTSWIADQYGGVDLAEQIRNYLIDLYQSEPLEYVLLVGSHEVIPMRFAYQPLSTSFAIPTDFYYADLTGDWDSNGNGVFAEVDIDEWPDFHPEVYVGRIPADDPGLVQAICRKTIVFEQSNDAWKHDVLLLGGVLNYENEVGIIQPKTDTAQLMELIRKDILEPNQIQATTMYEKDGLRPSIHDCTLPLTEENVISTWSQNAYGLVSWGGHGGPTHSYRKWWVEDKNINRIPDFNELDNESFITTFNTYSLDNERPSIIVSCSCSNMDIRHPKNLGTTMMQHGAVGFIGGTHLAYHTYGWNDTFDGGALTITYEFFKNFLTNQQTFGEAFFNTLSYCWYEEDISIIDPNIYVYNLLGDPSLGLQSYSSLEIPEKPHKPIGEQIIQPDRSYTYSTFGGMDDELIYYIWDFGDGTITEPMGPYSSSEVMSQNHTWQTPGQYRIKVKTVNVVGDESDWSEPILIRVEGPVLEIESITGGLFKINSIIRNNGNQDAEMINWSIEVQDGILLFGRRTSGSIPVLHPGAQYTLISRTIIGFGSPIFITVTTESKGGSTDQAIQSADLLFSAININ